MALYDVLAGKKEKEKKRKTCERVAKRKGRKKMGGVNELGSQDFVSKKIVLSFVLYTHMHGHITFWLRSHGLFYYYFFSLLLQMATAVTCLYNVMKTS